MPEESLDSPKPKMQSSQIFVLLSDGVSRVRSLLDMVDEVWFIQTELI